VAEEIRLDVVTVAHGRGFLDAADDARALRAEADRLDKSTAHLGDTFDDTEGEAFDLSRAMEDARVKASQLRAEFARTGNQGLFKDIRSEETLIRRLEKISKEIASTDGGGLGVTLGSAIGTRAGRGFSDSMEGAISALPSQLRGTAIVAAVSIGSAMAPFLGGAIAGAVTGAAGAGGIIGGIVAASGDPRVKSAWASFAERSLTGDAFGRQAFVEPTIAAIGELESALADMNIGDTLGLLADDVSVLAGGVGNFGRNLMPGLTEAFERAGPFVHELSDGLANMGSALGSFLDSVSSSPGAVMGLDVLFRTVNATIVLLGKNLEFLADAFGGAVVAGARISGFLEDIPLIGIMAGHWNDVFESIEGGATGAARALPAATAAIESQRKTFEELREEVRAATTAVDAFIGAELSVDEANLRVAEGLAQLREILAQNKGQWDLNSEAGRANNEVLLQQITNLDAQRRANIIAGADAAIANAKFDAELDTLLRLAGAAGASKEQLDRLKGTYSITVRVNALVDRILSSSLIGLANLGATGFLSGTRASGGPVGAGRSYLVGEAGPEILTMGGQGGYVHPSTLGGGRMAPIVVTDPFGQMLFTWIRKAVASAGGDVQAFFGRN
jgi:hypothetical protein